MLLNLGAWLMLDALAGRLAKEKREQKTRPNQQTEVAQ
jgi:hypothetical protein